MEPPKSLPKPVRHYLDVPDGRLLCYYSFTSSSPEDKGGERAQKQEAGVHPVLYLHGFPGCGYEGALCAAAAQRQGCEMYAVDRPGFGHTHPLKIVDDGTGAAQKGYVRGAVEDIWQLAKLKKWESFSVIAVSGGGPYALALLHSYLKYTSEGKSPDLPRLAGVSLVAGVFCTAGCDGMMDTNKKIFAVVSNVTNNQSSQIKRKLCWYFLLFQFIIQRFIILLIPLKWLGSFMSALMKGIPEVDADVFLNQIVFRDAFMESIKNSLRQSPVNAAFESTVLFRSCQGYEDELRSLWGDAIQKEQERRRLAASATVPPVDRFTPPHVSIFHGILDVNVPMAHSIFVYKNLLSGKEKLMDKKDESSFVTFHTYEDLGHVSIVTSKSDEVIQAIAPVK